MRARVPDWTHYSSPLSPYTRKSTGSARSRFQDFIRTQHGELSTPKLLPPMDGSPRQDPSTTQSFANSIQKSPCSPDPDYSKYRMVPLPRPAVPLGAVLAHSEPPNRVGLIWTSHGPDGARKNKIPHILLPISEHDQKLKYIRRSHSVSSSGGHSKQSARSVRSAYGTTSELPSPRGSLKSRLSTKAARDAILDGFPVAQVLMDADMTNGSVSEAEGGPLSSRSQTNLPKQSTYLHPTYSPRLSNVTSIGSAGAKRSKTKLEEFQSAKALSLNTGQSPKKKKRRKVMKADGWLKPEDREWLAGLPEGGTIHHRLKISPKDYMNTRRMFEFLDVNQSGQLSWQTMQDTEEITGKVMDYLTFKRIDKDRSGLIDFMELMRAIYPHVLVSEIKECVRQWKMPFSDLRKIEIIAKRENWRDKFTAEQLNEIIDIFDLFKKRQQVTSPLLTMDELRANIREKDLPDTMLVDLFHELDTDGNGTLSLKEFALALADIYHDNPSVERSKRKSVTLWYAAAEEHGNIAMHHPKA